jgi:hypothetical protein
LQLGATDFGQQTDFDRPQRATRVQHRLTARHRGRTAHDILTRGHPLLVQPDAAELPARQPFGLLDHHDGIGAFGNRRAGHDASGGPGSQSARGKGAGRDFFNNI